MIGPFSAGAINVFLNIRGLLLGAVAALVFPTIGIHLVISMFFPPHMTFPLTLEEMVALLLRQNMEKSWMEDRDKTAATALSIGTIFTVPILILLSIL